MNTSSQRMLLGHSESVAQYCVHTPSGLPSILGRHSPQQSAFFVHCSPTSLRFGYCLTFGGVIAARTAHAIAMTATIDASTAIWRGLSERPWWPARGW